MAKERKGETGEALKVPAESVELEGGIITAAKSTMEPKSYEKGYPEPPGRLHMKNWGGAKPK